MYKICVIAPITKPLMPKSKHIYQEYAPEYIETTHVYVSYGVDTVETFYDDEIAAPYVVDKAVQAEKDGYNGVIVDCFNDPGLEGAREACNIPVVGAGESSILLALSLGDTFTILSTSAENYVRRKPSRRILKLGVEKRFASIRGIGIPVYQIPHTDTLVDILTKEGIKAVREDNADVLILGCTGLGGLAKSIERKVRVPVVDPVEASMGLLYT
ncbi:hydrogenase expression protein HupH, partial [Thermococci archaeon]